MIQFIELGKLTDTDRNRIMRRAEKDIRDLLPLAQEVIDQVQSRGDDAVVALTQDLRNQVLLGREMPVERCLGHAGARDDLIDADVADAVRVEQRGRHAQQALARAFVGGGGRRVRTGH